MTQEEMQKLNDDFRAAKSKARAAAADLLDAQATERSAIAQRMRVEQASEDADRELQAINQKAAEAQMRALFGAPGQVTNCGKCPACLANKAAEAKGAN